MAMRKPTKRQLRKTLAQTEALLAKEFPKVRKMSDVSRMAKRDFVQYLRWNAHQHQIASVRSELERMK